MRAVTAVLVGVLIVVLVFIAYDLHRVARALDPVGVIGAGVVSLGSPTHETFEEHVQSIMRDDAKHDLEYKALIEAHRRELAKSRK